MAGTSSQKAPYHTKTQLYGRGKTSFKSTIMKSAFKLIILPPMLSSVHPLITANQQRSAFSALFLVEWAQLVWTTQHTYISLMTVSHHLRYLDINSFYKLRTLEFPNLSSSNPQWVALTSLHWVHKYVNFQKPTKNALSSGSGKQQQLDKNLFLNCNWYQSEM